MITPDNVKKGYLAGYPLEEYKSLREEILMIIKRGYEIYFSAIALSIGLLGCGIKIDKFTTSVIVILSPVFVLNLGFDLIREQVRTLRRNAAYIRIFHEGKDSDIFWETRLNKLRKDRTKESKAILKDITAADILSGFPTIIDVLSFVCVVLAIVKILYDSTKESIEEKAVAFSVTAIVVIIGVIIAFFRHRQCIELQGGGKIENEYAEEWTKQKQADETSRENEK
ncbi:MAG: hypothetical protein WC476_10440 [Phycisphaerae bacterium]|jgi:hypothetical protein